MSLVEEAKRIREDAEHSNFQLGKKSVRRIVELLVAMALKLEGTK